MPPAVPLATGLGGAIGSSLRPSANQLLFVEFAGRLSALDLVPSFTTVSSSPAAGAALRGTWQFDLDTGVEGTTGDIWWQQQTTVLRRMAPRAGAGIVRLGSVNFASVTPAYLESLTYSSTPIVGNNDASNQLTAGTVFAVRTNLGNYAKVLVLNYGYDLQIRWQTYRPNPRYRVLGKGYSQPEDIFVTAAGTHAYVTERTGTLLRVDLASPDRASAQVVASGLTAPHQIALDEEHGSAFVVEFANPGRLVRIDLASGAVTPVVGGLERPIGLLMTHDRRFAYVTEQTSAGRGRLVRYDLVLGSRVELATSAAAPLFFLRWADDGEAAILVTERDPANQAFLVDVTGAATVLTPVATGLPAKPSSVAVVSPSRLLVCSDTVISEVALTGSVYLPTGPILLGIGHVPVNRIVDGYADTTTDPTYFFQVKDAPFGGSLAVMINHQRAFAEGARWYRVEVDGAEPRQAFTDYLWNAGLGRFVLQTITPSAAGYYPVRSPGQLWYTSWLGNRLNTSGLANGSRKITIRLFGAQSAASEIGSGSAAGRSVKLQIDNSLPTARIEAIIHHHATLGQVVVGTCGIVDSESNRFSFRVTAADGVEQHLKSWSLVALWGDNKSAAVASAAYTPTPSRKWAGITNAVVPARPWTATERRCAHTFYLTVWDRVIDGYTSLHRTTYHKSITLMLP